MARRPSYRKAEREAGRLLRQFGIKRPPVDVRAIAREEGIEIREIEGDESVSGTLLEQRGKRVIAVNARHHPNRKRFSLAHELGHYYVHLQHGHKGEDIGNGVTVYFRDYLASQAIDSDEIEANAFAAALLMPESMLRKDAEGLVIDVEDYGTIRSLANRYKVSQQSMSFRLLNLGLLAGEYPPPS